MVQATAIYITSDVEFDPEHDEYQTFQVFEGDEDAEPVFGSIPQTFDVESVAIEYANGLARRGALEVYNES